jgi:hypothetical protein
MIQKVFKVLARLFAPAFTSWNAHYANVKLQVRLVQALEANR